MDVRLIQTKKINAFVLAGRGKASETRSAEIKEISEKFGISLINGSLNLISKSLVWLDSRKAIYTTIYSNGLGHFYWKAYLNNIPVIVNRWSGRCPVHVFEIFAEEHLRTKFGLSDGDSVALEILAEILDPKKNSSMLNRIVWYLTWRGREQLAYRDGIYTAFIFHMFNRKLTGRAYHDSIS